MKKEIKEIYVHLDTIYKVLDNYKNQIEVQRESLNMLIHSHNKICDYVNRQIFAHQIVNEEIQ